MNGLATKAEYGLVMMFDRMSNGWVLIRQSWEVLKLDKELLVFPLISGVVCLLVMASFAVPVYSTGLAEEVFAEQQAMEEGEGGSPIYQIVAGVVMFAYYFVSYFVVVFFNSALISCAIIRFKGGNPNLQDGFSASFSRLPQIAGWALVAATVGFILRMIESRSEKVGQFVTGLLGMAWSAVTFFVVPVIVVEQAGPITALKRSFAVLKRTWGEALTANFGIGFFVFLASLVGILPIGLGIYLCISVSVVAGVVLIALGAIYLLIVSLVSSALNAIVIAALYLYAAEGTVPQQFDDQMFRAAFAHK